VRISSYLAVSSCIPLYLTVRSVSYRRLENGIMATQNTRSSGGVSSTTLALGVGVINPSSRPGEGANVEVETETETEIRHA